MTSRGDSIHRVQLRPLRRMAVAGDNGPFRTSKPTSDAHVTKPPRDPQRFR
jgi:hypothetical protein